MKILGDIEGILITIGFVFIIIGLGEGLRKTLRLPRSFTRKLVHIGVGNWIFLWPFAFENWYALLAPPALFAVLNYLSYKREIFKAMEREEKAGGLGTVYYAIANAIVAPSAMYLNRIWIAAIAIMLLAWADGLADIIGRRYGRHRYTLAGAQRSVEGSIGFLLIGTMSVIITLGYFSAFYKILIDLWVPLLSFFIAGLGALIEAISPKGTDNLTIPLTIFAVLLVLSWPA